MKNGNRSEEWLGLLLRACPGPIGMLRFGTFDLANGPELDPKNSRAGPSPGQAELVESLVLALAASWPPSVGAVPKPGLPAAAAAAKAALLLLERATDGSARLAARWAALGFVHGMLNTDNCHVLGVTIDAASGCFMSAMDPDDDASGPSTARGRYALRRQPRALRWGLQKLAAALAQGACMLPLDTAMCAVSKFQMRYRASWLREMRAKLGLSSTASIASHDRRLIKELLHTMELTFSDFTATFRCLMPAAPVDGFEMLKALEAFSKAPPLTPAARGAVLRARAVRIRPSEPRELLQQLLAAKTEPPVGSKAGTLQRRHLKISKRLAQHDHADALEGRAEAASLASLEMQCEADAALWSTWLTRYAERCAAEPSRQTTGEQMRRANPCFVPRAWVLDAVASAAQHGNLAPAQSLVQLLPHVYDEETDFSGFDRVRGP